ncbi:DUF4192 domain-containing protein [Cellulomonas sp. H30R-01]|uniref:DUF4192 domain-containing protein n=1 Tax=Cellulomonas sp. H30R-01 TaxID=2704467 RepID=UPI00138C597B|nr:DUF4192 domain-containing protein [Cellulomonas sp. H30R-01]QHT55967.1 DUF4192 domain-containing protein [Cellulomonas sp. H30R-01]
MDTTTLRVSEPRELLALVPYRLGFRPEDSAVAISLRPPRGQVGLVVRVDLEQLADPDDGGRCARALVGLLDQDGARRAVLVLYVEDDPRTNGTDAADATGRAVEAFREASAVPLGDVVVWVVTASGYLALDCTDHACCPPGGRPLRDLDSTQTSARMVLAGSAVAGSRGDLGRIRRADEDARRGAARTRRRWERRRETAAAQGPRELAAWRQDCLAAWRAAVAGEQAAADRGAGADASVRPPSRTSAGDTRGVRGGPGRAPWGRVEAGLVDRRVRDAVLVGMLPGTGDLPERSVTGESPAPAVDAAVGAAVATLVDPARAMRPPADVDVHERVLERVVAHGRAGGQAPALTLLAMLAWWRGDGARAAVLLERALADDPGHRLAVLLADVLAAAVPPGWVRSAS